MTDNPAPWANGAKAARKLMVKLLKRQRFKSPGSAQRFFAVHAATYNTFYYQRHLLSRTNHENLRCGSFDAWAMASAAG